MKEKDYVCLYQNKIMVIDQIKKKKEDCCYLKETRQWLPETKLLTLTEGEVIYKKEHAKAIQDLTNPNSTIDLAVVITLLEFNKHKVKL